LLAIFGHHFGQRISSDYSSMSIASGKQNLHISPTRLLQGQANDLWFVPEHQRQKFTKLFHFSMSAIERMTGFD
jgi:hypothetical protein